MKNTGNARLGKLNITSLERKKYPLSEEGDIEILFKIKKLERRRLLPEDRRLVKLIRTQLEKDWRKPLIKELDKISGRYA